MIGQYSLGEAVKNAWALLLTKLLFPRARLVRRPFYLRGKRHFSYGKGLTTGYSCRFDLGGSETTLIIGDNCKMNDRVHIVAHEKVVIGDNVLMASNIFISDTSHGEYREGGSAISIAPDDRPLVTSPTSIGDNVWIGEGAIIMPGVSLGRGCIVGANAVVTHSYPEGCILAGSPAKPIKRWNVSEERWVSERD